MTNQNLKVEFKNKFSYLNLPERSEGYPDELLPALFTPLFQIPHPLSENLSPLIPPLICQGHSFLMVGLGLQLATWIG